MSALVLPVLAGLTWPVERHTIFQTRKQVSISGKEVRIADWSTPRYQWVQIYSVLRQGQFNRVTQTEFSTLEGFFEQLQGGYDSFLYPDVVDNAVTNQSIGIGTGAQKTYQLQRTFGGATIPVLAPNLTQSFAVTVNGVAVAPANYTVLPWGTTDTRGPGTLNFVTAPIAGSTILASFSYYFPVRWDDDDMTFSNFMSGLFELKKASFQSIK